jgi:hypothetical protein
MYTLVAFTNTKDISTYHYVWVEAILVLGFIISWYSVSSIDPIFDVNEKGYALSCYPTSRTTAKFCGQCFKSVRGLDHHCNWLNTCVGNKNYIAFFAMITFGVSQMIYQTALSFLFQLEWMGNREDEISKNFSTKTIARVVVAIVGFLSLLSAINLVVIMAFHLWLMCSKHAGTYDWMLARRGLGAEDESSGIMRGQEQKQGNNGHANDAKSEWEEVLRKQRQTSLIRSKAYLNFSKRFSKDGGIARKSASDGGSVHHLDTIGASSPKSLISGDRKRCTSPEINTQKGQFAISPPASSRFSMKRFCSNKVSDIDIESGIKEIMKDYDDTDGGGGVITDGGGVVIRDASYSPRPPSAPHEPVIPPDRVSQDINSSKSRIMKKHNKVAPL